MALVAPRVRLRAARRAGGRRESEGRGSPVPVDSAPGGAPGRCRSGAVFPAYREKPRGGEAPGLRERGRRSGQRSLSRQFVFGQFIVQVTKLPMFAVPKVPLVALLGAPVRSSSPSASQVQVKDTSIVWVHSLVS